MQQLYFIINNNLPSSSASQMRFEQPPSMSKGTDKWISETYQKSSHIWAVFQTGIKHICRLNIQISKVYAFQNEVYDIIS